MNALHNVFYTQKQNDNIYFQVLPWKHVSYESIKRENFITECKTMFLQVSDYDRIQVFLHFLMQGLRRRYLLFSSDAQNIGYVCVWHTDSQIYVCAHIFLYLFFNILKNKRIYTDYFDIVAGVLQGDALALLRAKNIDW